MSTLKKLAPLAFALALFGILMFLAASGQVSGDSPVVAQGKFGGWGYVSMEEADGSITTRITYQAGSLDELRKFVQENKRLAAELAKAGISEVDTVITFNHVLPLADFEAWAATQPLSVRSYVIRLTGTDSLPVTLGGGPTANGLVDREMLESILDHLADRGATDLRGVIGVEGTLRASDYDRLAADPNVFLVDVSGSFARSEVNKNASLRNKKQDVIMPPSAFGYLEDFGLATYN